MKKIIYITCCFVFAGVCSSSEYTLSDSNDNPRAFNSSDSSIHDDSKITTHAMNNPSRKRSRRSVDINQSSKIRKNKEVYTDLYDTYCDDPDKFLDDIKSSKGKELENIIYTLNMYDFFYESWPQDTRLYINKKLKDISSLNGRIVFEENPYERYRGLLNDTDKW